MSRTARARSIVEVLFTSRIVRFITSSGISAVVGALVLVGAYAWGDLPAWLASLMSFVAAGIVSFVLYRRWAFQRQGRSELMREVLPFTVLSAVTLAWATAGAQLGASLAHRLTTDRPIQSVVVLAAVITASIIAIPIRYVICYWIFGKEVAETRMHVPVGRDVAEGSLDA